MRIGLIIYGSLDNLSGGYLYDRKLVEYLRAQGDTVEIISLPWRNYAAHLMDNFHFRLPSNLDVLIQDELNHPSLILANRGKHLFPIISLVHHLRCSERRPAWQNAIYRMVEKRYLLSVDDFIFNSQTTRNVVYELIGSGKPSVIAYPPTDRFGEPISQEEILTRAKTKPFRILFLGNVIERKGLDTLLNAHALDKNSSLRARSGQALMLDVVGSLTSDPSYVKAIRGKIRSLGLSSFVSLHGPLDNQPLIENLRQSHVLVVPSSYEGYGIAYLEGMCFGLPVIGTTAGGAREIISDEVDGFLIEPGDVDLLANRLRFLNERRDVLVRLSLAARERYLRQPSWEETAGSIRNFLYAVTNSTN